MKNYNLVVCGGTFDHLHRGHKEFLRHALSISRKILIGLTSDKYIKTKNNSELIENYKLRKKQLEKFLRQENATDRVLIEPIDDIFIPKVWEKLPIEAIVVSENTINGAEKINLRRKEQQKSPLKIEAYSLIKSNENGYISSSRIRNGEINREGRPYIKPLWLKHNLVITEKLKRQLRKPFGMLLRKSDSLESLKLISRHSGKRSASRIPLVQRDSGQDGYQTVTRQARMMPNPYLITVGDITTNTFNKLGLEQDISVIDFKVARQIQFSNLKELDFSGGEKIIKISNPAGCLTPALFKAVSGIFKLKAGYKSRLHPERAQASRRIPIILQIDGEEDLSVLPFILAAPLGSVIFYGQPREGVVKVEVSEKSKERAFDLVDQFRLRPSITRGY